MAIVFMTDPATGRCALYEEAPGGGDFDDPNSLRNRPLNNPGAWLANIYFHTDLDLMEVSHGPTDVTIGHATIAAGSGGITNMLTATSMVYSGAPTDHTLLNHGLGYVPDFLVIVDGDVVYPGRAMQTLGDGRTRSICAWADASNIYLREWFIQSASALPAITLTYTVLVFRRPPAATGTALIDFDPATGVVKMGLDKFKSDRRYLQVRAGGLPFGFPLGKTIDAKNGAPRLVDPDGTITEVVPSSLQLAFATAYQTSGFSFGPSGAYTGSFTGSAAVLVQAP